MIILFFLFLFCSIPVAFFNIRIGVIILIAYRLLVPFNSFKIGISFEYNYAVLGVLLVFIWQLIRKKEKFDYVFASPFIIFILLVVFSVPFAADLDAGTQLTALRVFVISNFVLPVIIWHVFKTRQDIDVLVKVLVFCMCIMLVYGLYCFVSKSNVYVNKLSSVFSAIDNNEAFLKSKKQRTDLVGKISSTTSHPFIWSCVLAMFLISLNSLSAKKNVIYYFLTVLGLVNLAVCNVRTGIIAFVAGFIMLIAFRSGKSRIMLIVLAVGLICLGGIDTSIFGKYKRYADSIIYFYDSNKSIGGSSLDMREAQLRGAIDLWYKGSFVFGNGFGWCGNYYALHGDHPILLGFESIIYVVIIENGLVGILLWGGLFFGMYLVNRKYNLANGYSHLIVNSLIFTSLAFCVVSGIFGLNMLLIFWAVIIRSNFLVQNNTIKIYVTNITGS